MKLNASIIEDLRIAAVNAAKNAYCPYSNFPVGASVLTENGEIFSGCNVENVSFGLTICAERSAIFQAISKGHKGIVAIVVVTPTNSPIPPCGACRQVINEFGGSNIDVFSFSIDQKFYQCKLEDLLPRAFGPQDFK